LKEFFVTLLWVVFIADSVLLVLIVLLQSGRGGGLSGMLGGGGMAESALGPKSGLPRITGVMAAIFFVSAILIGILTRPREALQHKEPAGKGVPAATSGAPGDEPAAEQSPESAKEAGGAEKDTSKAKGPSSAPEPRPTTGVPAKSPSPTTSDTTGERP